MFYIRIAEGLYRKAVDSVDDSVWKNCAEPTENVQEEGFWKRNGHGTDHRTHDSRIQMHQTVTTIPYFHS
jgi:hypothetical protein